MLAVAHSSMADPQAAPRDLARGAADSSTRVDAAPALSFGDAPRPVGQTPEGYNVWRGTASYGDVVLPYRDTKARGGVRYEYRPADEVLSDDAIATLTSKVVTNNHPDKLLDASNTAEHFEGVVHKAWREGDKLRVEIYSMSKSLDDAIRSGKIELSPGYDTDVVMRPGKAANGQDYDAVQTNVRYNHLSLVDRARTRKPNGEVARLTKDAADMLDKTDDTENAGGADETSTARKDALSPEAMEMLSSMPEADKAKVEEALAAHYAEKAGGEEGREDMPEASADEDEGSMKEVMDAIRALGDRISKMEMAKKDMPKKDAHLDGDDIIARAAEQARVAAREESVATVAELDAVRRVTMDSGCYVDGDALASKLAYVKHVTPANADLADAAVRSSKFDTLDTLFEVAQRDVEQKKKHADSIDQSLARRLLASANANAPITHAQASTPAGRG